jgi:hypothetical protein
MNEHELPATGLGTKTRSQIATIGDVEDALRESGTAPRADRSEQDDSRDKAILELAKQINDVNKRVARAIEVAKQIDELIARVSAIEADLKLASDDLASTVPDAPSLDVE